MVDLHHLSAAALSGGVEVGALLRLNPDAAARGTGLAMGGVPSQFGVDVAAVRARPSMFTAPAVRIAGFQIFTGSNAPDLKTLHHWAHAAVTAAADAAAALGTILTCST